MPSTLAQDLQFAIELARGAGKIVLDHYGKVSRLTKRHAEAVTDADRASQRYIVAGLKRHTRLLDQKPMVLSDGAQRGIALFRVTHQPQM